MSHMRQISSRDALCWGEACPGVGLERSHAPRMARRPKCWWWLNILDRCASAAPLILGLILTEYPNTAPVKLLMEGFLADYERANPGSKILLWYAIDLLGHACRLSSTFFSELFVDSEPFGQSTKLRHWSMAYKSKILPPPVACS